MNRADWIPRFIVGWRQKINPIFWFGNLDDGAFAPWYMPGSNTLWRTIFWFARNPMHNLTFYVLGACGSPSFSWGKEPGNVFADAGGWNWAVTIVAGWLPLPFVSFIGRFKFYIGWRPPGGALGVKITRV